MSINKAMISGNLTRDSELRQSQSGFKVLNFSVAVNVRKKNPQTGEWQDVPNFIDCVVFGTRAEKLAQYLFKGTKVALDGELRQSTWQTQDNLKRSKIEIVVDNLDFMSRQQGQTQQVYAPSQPVQQPAQSAYQQEYDADIPF